MIRYVYAYQTNSNLDDLVIEEGKSDGFEAYKISELENLTDDEKERFISKMLEPEQVEMYKEIVSKV